MEEGEKSLQVPDTITNQMIYTRIRELSSPSPQQNTLLKQRKEMKEKKRDKRYVVRVGVEPTHPEIMQITTDLRRRQAFT